MPRGKTLTAILFVSIALFPLAGVGEGQECPLAEGQRAWLQGALRTWEAASHVLEVDRRPLPWVVVYDGECEWHLQGGPAAGKRLPDTGLRWNSKRVEVRSRKHSGNLRLPTGKDLPAKPVAFAAPYDNGKKAFFVLALPDLWREMPSFHDEKDVEGFVYGILSHEMVHTLHVTDVNRRIDELSRRFRLPEHLDDDLLQRRMEKDPDYVQAWEEEMDLLWEAVASRDDREARRLAREALARAAERRQRFFTGDNEQWVEIEPLFLNMEGVASWAAYQVSEPRPQDLKKFAGRFWSQQQGLALFILIDRFTPGWKMRVFRSDVPSPFEMLAGGVAEP